MIFQRHGLELTSPSFYSCDSNTAARSNAISWSQTAWYFMLIQIGVLFSTFFPISLQGVKNTALLKTYTEIDERFHKLGFAIKHWAGLCDINDAASGTLSSYAWMNLLVFYLQRTTPPVLPFLQQARPSDIVFQFALCHESSTSS